MTYLPVDARSVRGVALDWNHIVVHLTLRLFQIRLNTFEETVLFFFRRFRQCLCGPDGPALPSHGMDVSIQKFEIKSSTSKRHAQCDMRRLEIMPEENTLLDEIFCDSAFLPLPTHPSSVQTISRYSSRV